MSNLKDRLEQLLVQYLYNLQDIWTLNEKL